MNFLCDKCKQKYHVADEKLRGRAVTRFRCKKCEHIIELQAPPESTLDAPAEGAVTAGSSAPPPAASAPLPRIPPAPAVPRPRAATMTSPIGTSQPAAPRAPGVSPLAAPMAPRPAVSRPRAMTTTGPAFGGGGAGAAPRPAAPRPAPAPRSPEAARSPSASAILNASETGWYAGIRDLPVGPLTRKELAARVQAGDVTADTLVWREGLDDWRPLRAVAELGDLLRIAAQQLSGDLLDEMGKRPVQPVAQPERSRSAQVLPLSAARGAAPVVAVVPQAAPPSAHPDLDDDEATRVSGMDRDLIAAIQAGTAGARAPGAAFDELTNPDPRAALQALHTPPAAPARQSVRPPPSPQSQGAAQSVRPPAPAPAPVADAQPAAPVAPVVATQPLAPAPPRAPQGPSVTVPLEAPMAALFAAPSPPAAVPDLFAGAPRPDPAAIASPTAPTTVAPPPMQPRGGLPAGAYVMMVGVLVVGIVGGLALGRVNNHPVQPPVMVHPAPPPVEAPVAPPVRLAAPPIQLPAEVPPAGETPVPVPPVVTTPGVTAPGSVVANDHTPRSHRPAGAAGTGPGEAPRALSAADQAMLREAERAGGGPAGGPVTTTTRSAPTDEPAGGSGPTGGARGGQIVNAFNNARIINNCWQASLRINPALSQRPTRVTVDITVDGRGRVTGTSVGNSPTPSFDNCVQGRARSMAPLGGGEAMTARASYNLDVNN